MVSWLGCSLGGNGSSWGVSASPLQRWLAVRHLTGHGDAGSRSSGAVHGVALATLPGEAQDTHRSIRTGGPFPYAKDGTVFGNRERLLPRQAARLLPRVHGQDAGARDRGARRIVCGGQPPTQPEACYYTADHYASFRRIVANERI